MNLLAFSSLGSLMQEVSMAEAKAERRRRRTGEERATNMLDWRPLFPSV